MSTGLQVRVVRLSRSIAVAGVSAVAALGAPALADEIIVPTDFPLSVALAVAQNDDTITILPGVYQQVPGYAFANKRLTVRGSTGNPDDVVLDGSGLTVVLTISQAGAAGSIIQDLTIAHGLGGAAADSSGAGVHISGGANVTFSNCVIRDNNIPAPDANGAGIYATSSSIRIENCILENNTLDSSIGDGAAVYFNGGAHVILDTIFRHNGVVTGTDFANGSVGGALYADAGSAQIARCTFDANRSYQGGAVFAAGNMVISIDACTFDDNQAFNGAGFFISSTSGGAAPRIRNSLFVGNTALNVATIYTDKGGFFTNDTLVANTSGSYLVGGGTSSSIDNCIFWGNTYNTTNGLFPAATPDLVRRCILQQAYAGAAGSGNNQVIDPLFVDAPSRDFHLSDQSPAIDAGDSNLYFGPFADLDGNNRGVDVPDVPDTGSSISGPVIDIGAYEVQTEPPLPECPPDFNRDGVLNSQDFFDFITAFFTGCP